MARPIVTDKRKEEILLAYERCIAKFGVYGATLAAIAKEAGVSRPLVRHHVGNQNELLTYAIERFVERTKTQLEASKPSDFSNVKELIDVLFDAESMSENNDTLVANAFISASSLDENIRSHMQQWMKILIEWFYNNFAFHHPNVPEMKIRPVAAGVMGIYFNVDSLVPIEADFELRNYSKLAALSLASSL